MLMNNRFYMLLSKIVESREQQFYRKFPNDSKKTIWKDSSLKEYKKFLKKLNNELESQFGKGIVRDCLPELRESLRREQNEKLATWIAYGGLLSILFPYLGSAVKMVYVCIFNSSIDQFPKWLFLLLLFIVIVIGVGVISYVRAVLRVVRLKDFFSDPQKINSIALSYGIVIYFEDIIYFNIDKHRK